MSGPVEASRATRRIGRGAQGEPLTPTDPVFAAAIVGSEHVPSRVRFLLNVESGLNDGLALPIVVVMLDLIRATVVEPGTIVINSPTDVLAVRWLQRFGQQICTAEQEREEEEGGEEEEEGATSSQ